MGSKTCLKSLMKRKPVRAGVTDHLAESEPHAISIARNILGNLNKAAAGMSATWGQQLPDQAGMQQVPGGIGRALKGRGGAWEEPLFPSQEMRGMCCALPCCAVPS